MTRREQQVKQLQRWGLLLAMSALIIGLLSACGGGNANDNAGGSASTADTSASPSTEASATEQPEATPGTRSVTTLAGTIDIPSEPRRIVLTYDDDIDHFMALGLKPVAAPVYDRADNVNGFLPYLADQLEGMATFPLSADFEPILKAEPDLLVAGYHHRDYLQELQKIAPTVYFEWNVDWRKTHLEMGRVLNLEEKAKANVDGFNAEMEITKAHLAETIGTEPVAFMRVRENQLELYGGAGTGSSASFILYDLLGLTPVKDAATDTWGAQYSLESFTRSEAEHLVLLVQENEENLKLVDDLLANPLYKNVPAIQKGQVYKVFSFPWERGGPIAFTQGMKDIREMFK
jgi:iron complex transport system substrate-binding protein